MEQQPKKRTDLIDLTGSVTRNFKIINALEYPTGVSIRVSEKETGDVYWTSLEDVELDR